MVRLATQAAAVRALALWRPGSATVINPATMMPTAVLIFLKLTASVSQ